MDDAPKNPHVHRFMPGARAPVRHIGGMIEAIDLTAETGRGLRRLPNALTNSGWMDSSSHFWVGLNVVADAFGDPALNSQTLRLGNHSIAVAAGISTKTLQRANRAVLDGATRWLFDLGATLPTSAAQVGRDYRSAHPHGGAR